MLSTITLRGSAHILGKARRNNKNAHTEQQRNTLQEPAGQGGHRADTRRTVELVMKLTCHHIRSFRALCLKYCMCLSKY